jgi:hypothetical protein
MRRHNDFSAAQVRAARGLLDWSQERLAAVARIPVEDLQELEAGSLDIDPG